MTAPYVLPRAVAPLEDETLASLITRNARAYGFDNVMLVLNPLGLSRQQPGALAFAKPDAALAPLLNVDPPTLHALSSWHGARGMARVGGREIRRILMHVNFRRPCPACLRESLHHRALWDVIAISSCPRHGRRLIEICPGCGKPPVWRGPRMEKCGNSKCSFDLRSVALADSDAVPAYVSGLSLLYDGGVDAVMPNLELGFGKAVEAAYMIGSRLRRSGPIQRPDMTLRKKPKRALEVMEAGWHALCDWPNNFHEMLDECRAEAGARFGQYGLKHEFGDLATWLSGSVDEAWTIPLRAAFADYLKKKSDLRLSARGLRPFGPPSRLRNSHLTLRDASRLLAVSPQVMAELAERENLYLVRPSRPGAPTLLHAEGVERLKERTRETITLEQALELLGVGPRVLEHFLDAELLKLVPRIERVTNHRNLIRSEVESIVRRVYESVEEAAPTGRLVPLAHSIAGRTSVSNVVEAILDGRLRARGTLPDLPGLRGILVDTLEVRNAFLADYPKTMSLVDAAERLSVDIESLRIWAALGYLPTSAPLPHERGKRVAETDLETFSENYVTAVELGRLASTTARWASDRLLFHGHSPICDSSPTKLYKREVSAPEIITVISKPNPLGRSGSLAQTGVIRQRVKNDVGRSLGLQLQRSPNGFSDQSRRTQVQVLVGRRARCRSKFTFRFNPGTRSALSAAENAWLVLAPASFDTYVLIPWSHAQTMVGNVMDHRHWIHLDVDARGRVVNDPVLERMQRWILDS